MSDEIPPVQPENEPAEERSYTVLATVGLIIVIVIVVLLFWRSCAAESDSGGSRSGGATIESVEGLEAGAGAVSVWVRPDASIAEVLARNGLSSARTVDMGEGTYVIEIGDRDVDEVVETLKDDPGLYDAGYLYEGE